MEAGCSVCSGVCRCNSSLYIKGIQMRCRASNKYKSFRNISLINVFYQPKHDSFGSCFLHPLHDYFSDICEFSCSFFCVFVYFLVYPIIYSLILAYDLHISVNIVIF